MESGMYDGFCPYCGKQNKGLYLEETNGWMECIRCRRDVHLSTLADLPKVPTRQSDPEAWLCWAG